MCKGLNMQLMRGEQSIYMHHRMRTIVPVIVGRRITHLEMVIIQLAF